MIWRIWDRMLRARPWRMDRRWLREEKLLAYQECRTEIDWASLETAAYSEFFEPLVLWCQLHGYNPEDVHISTSTPLTFEETLSAPLPPPYTGFAYIEGVYYPFWSR